MKKISASFINRFLTLYIFLDLMLLETVIEKPDVRRLAELQSTLFNTVNFYQEVYQFQFPSVAMIFGENWDYLARVFQFMPANEALNRLQECKQ